MHGFLVAPSKVRILSVTHDAELSRHSPIICKRAAILTDPESSPVPAWQCLVASGPGTVAKHAKTRPSSTLHTVTVILAHIPCTAPYFCPHLTPYLPPYTSSR